MKTFTDNPTSPLLQVMFVAVIAGAGLVGCNTMAGMGEDVEATGEAIEEEAAEEKRY